MRVIKGKHLIKLGFKKEVNIPTSDRDTRFHYYTYEIKAKHYLYQQLVMKKSMVVMKLNYMNNPKFILSV
jgi:hypothetical protein